MSKEYNGFKMNRKLSHGKKLVVEEVAAIYRELQENALKPKGEQLTQQELSEAIGVSKMALSSIKQGKHKCFVDGVLEHNPLSCMSAGTQRGKAFYNKNNAEIKRLKRAGCISGETAEVLEKQVRAEYGRLMMQSGYRRKTEALSAMQRKKQEFLKFEDISFEIQEKREQAVTMRQKVQAEEDRQDLKRLKYYAQKAVALAAEGKITPAQGVGVIRSQGVRSALTEKVIAVYRGLLAGADADAMRAFEELGA
ncbi:hypothetical protein [Endozoicomonas acroporae]|uniref:hypothetical protein n=1 Tax=Endozoicomonas acroporae TaxID=1701104 RepID=UPI003D79CF41